MPYMCWQGTVATIQGRAVSVGNNARTAAALSAVVARRADQALRWAAGMPVLPEVWPITATKSSWGATGAATLAGPRPAGCSSSSRSQGS